MFWTDKKHIGYNLQVSIKFFILIYFILFYLAIGFKWIKAFTKKNCFSYKSVIFFYKVSRQHAGTNLFIVLSRSAAENNQWHRFVPEASFSQISYSFH